MTPQPAALSFQWFAWLGTAHNPQADGMFDPATIDAAWPVTAAHLRTFYLRYGDLNGGIFKDRKQDESGTALLVEVLGECRERNIRVGVNVPTRYRCDGRAALLEKIVWEFRRIAALGFVVDDVQFQSAISGAIQTPDCKLVYPKAGGLAARVADVVDGTRRLREVYPRLRPVVADTAAAKDDEEHSAAWDIERDYTALVEGMDRADLPMPAFHLAFEDTEAGRRLRDVKHGLAVCRGFGAETAIKPIVPVVAGGAATYVARFDAFVRKLWAGGEAAWPDEVHCTAWNREESGVIMYPETDPGAITYATAGWIRDGMIRGRAV